MPTKLGVTIAGQPLDHLIYHFALVLLRLGARRGGPGRREFSRRCPPAAKRVLAARGRAERASHRQPLGRNSPNIEPDAPGGSTRPVQHPLQRLMARSPHAQPRHCPRRMARSRAGTAIRDTARSGLAATGIARLRHACRTAGPSSRTPSAEPQRRGIAMPCGSRRHMVSCPLPHTSQLRLRTRPTVHVTSSSGFSLRKVFYNGALSSDWPSPPGAGIFDRPGSNCC